MGVVEKFGFYLVLVLIGGILVMIYFSENGIRDYRALRDKEAAVTSQVRSMETENRQMEKEITSLRKDARYIKHLAKHEHDMAEPDELIFKQKPSKEQTP